jgi:hypothetical protein
MRIPKDSLEEFFANRAAPKAPPPPPEPVQLEFTGETEIVKPLARWEPPLEIDTAVEETPRPYLLSCFHRSLVFGGALATMVVVLGTGMFLAFFGPPIGLISDPSYVAVSEDPTELIPPEDEDVTASDLFMADSSPSAFTDTFVAPPTVKRRRVRPRARSYANRQRVMFAANRQRRPARLRPQMIWSDFVPTNMIIYVENGLVKTRIEPQLTAVYKRVPTGSQQ